MPEPTNLTVECPGCRQFHFMHPLEWQEKKASGKHLGCLSCGTCVPVGEWRLRSVPWLRVVA